MHHFSYSCFAYIICLHFYIIFSSTIMNHKQITETFVHIKLINHNHSEIRASIYVYICSVLKPTQS